MSGINPVIYDFSVSCCYFETTGETSEKLETYIQKIVAVGHALRNLMYIILKFLLRIFLPLWLLVQDTVPSQ